MRGTSAQKDVDEFRSPDSRCGDRDRRMFWPLRSLTCGSAAPGVCSTDSVFPSLRLLPFGSFCKLLIACIRMRLKFSSVSRVGIACDKTEDTPW